MGCGRKNLWGGLTRADADAADGDDGDDGGGRLQFRRRADWGGRKRARSRRRRAASARAKGAGGEVARKKVEPGWRSWWVVLWCCGRDGALWGEGEEREADGY